MSQHHPMCPAHDAPAKACRCAEIAAAEKGHDRRCPQGRRDALPCRCAAIARSDAEEAARPDPTIDKRIRQAIDVRKNV